MFKKMKGTLHSYHAKQISTKFESLGVETRQKNDVLINGTCFTSVSKINSLNYKIGNAWNTLPFEIKSRSYKTLYTFTKTIKSHYISKYSKVCEVKKCYVCNKR